MRWAVENGCPTESLNGTLVAYGGHLAILKWLYQNIFRDNPYWLEAVCVKAALSGHVQVIEWALESGAEWKTTIL